MKKVVWFLMVLAQAGFALPLDSERMVKLDCGGAEGFDISSVKMVIRTNFHERNAQPKLETVYVSTIESKDDGFRKENRIRKISSNQSMNEKFTLGLNNMVDLIWDPKASAQIIDGVLTVKAPEFSLTSGMGCDERSQALTCKIVK